MSKTILIAGGGITGLSLAWYLQCQRPDWRVHLIEAEPYWGGKVVSETIDLPEGRLVIEGGPESFVTRKVEMVELATELGLRSQLVAAPSQASKMRILSDGRPLPAPMSPWAFISTPLLSTPGKLRMMAEPLIPARRDNEDESLADFVDRRLGREARQKFVGPVLAGIYNTNPETQSILTTAPVMRDLEKHGSLVRGAFARIGQRRRTPKSRRLPQFVTFAQGTQMLANELAQRLQADRRLKTRLVELRPAAGGGWLARLSDGETIHADAAALTGGANGAAQLLAEAAPAAAGCLGQIRYTHIGTISLVYRSADLPAGLDVSGVMIPRSEGRPIDALTCVRAPLNPRLPPGYTLIKVFFGGGRPETVELDDESLQQVVCAELRALLGIENPPSVVRIFRWPDGFPQADVGHLKLVDEIEALLPPGVFVAGAAYRGLGVPDCIRQAAETARRLIDFFEAGV